MKVSCPHCAQRISLDAEVLRSLSGLSHFECPTCASAVQVPTQQASLGGLAADHLLARAMETPQPLGNGWEAPEPQELDASLGGRYRITNFLGRGGMGAVYRGVDTRLDRAVAIKVLPIENTDHPVTLARFEQEAKAMASLDHPHTVKVFDFGTTAEGHVYIVMEYVDGRDLRALRQSGELSLAQALELISQVCAALHYAHERGIVHRDVKPANILVTRDGRAKVADFGVARIVQAEGGRIAGEAFTETGNVVGTPDYMAPEQRTGQKVDRRADLYALGVMLYEFLTGALPRGSWPLPSETVAVDARLDEIVLRALQEKPAARYQYAAEFKLDLDWVKVTTGGQPLPPGVDPDPLPSSQAGGPLAPRHHTPLADKSQRISPAAFDQQSTELILKTTNSLNTTTLILGLVALLTIGGVALFLANRKTGDTYNTENSTSSTETNTNYVTQVFGTPLPPADILAHFTDTHPLVTGLVGIEPRRSLVGRRHRIRRALGWQDSLHRRDRFDDAARAARMAAADPPGSALRSYLGRAGSPGSAFRWTERGRCHRSRAPAQSPRPMDAHGRRIAREHRAPLNHGNHVPPLRPGGRTRSRNIAVAGRPGALCLSGLQ